MWDPVTATTSSTRTPAQQRVADELLSLHQQRPVADPSWAPELRRWIDEALVDHVPRIRQRRLWVGKSSVAGVLSCEAHYVGGRSDFRWTPRTARGEVIHRAIALTAAGSKAEPRDLAWAAIDQARATGGRSLATWLRGLPEADRVALAAEALPGIDGFLSTWPALQPSWRPVPEYPVAPTSPMAGSMSQGGWICRWEALGLTTAMRSSP